MVARLNSCVTVYRDENVPCTVSGALDWKANGTRASEMIPLKPITRLDEDNSVQAKGGGQFEITDGVDSENVIVRACISPCMQDQAAEECALL